MAADNFFEQIIATVAARQGQTVDLSAANRRFLESANRAARQAQAPQQPRQAPQQPRQAPRRSQAPPPQQQQQGPPPPQPLPDLAQMSLAQIEAFVATCNRCQLHRLGRQQTVFARGNPDAELMFVGEGPGFDEDRLGEPFVGRAGALLDRMITAMQYERDEVYVSNIVKCRPPNNRNPEAAEGNACLPYLQRQIELVAPKVIVTLGAVPLDFLCNRRGIKRTRGTWLDYQGIPVMPTFHPAYLLRFENDKGLVWDDLQQVMRRLGKDPANTRR